MDWKEIEKLAAEFQSAQLSTNLQKITENHCIEIVNKLIDNKCLDVIFTNDRKEYVTKEYLKMEMINELSYSGGRMNLNELAQVLNVNLNQITASVTEMQTHNSGFHVILGDLINEEYWVQMMNEINDKLWHQYYVKIVDLTLFYNFPAEFIRSTIEAALTRKIIKDVKITQDKQIYYTHRFVNKCKAKLRGALSAVTKPVALSVVSNKCSIPDFVMFSTLNDLQHNNSLPGVVTGDQIKTSVFLPHIYVKSQTQWIQDFYKQNGYLEYDALTRLGISDPKNLIKKYFPNDDIMYLKSVAVNTVIIDQIKSVIDDVINTKSSANIHDFLPSIFNREDVGMLLVKVVENYPVMVFGNCIVVSEQYIQSLEPSFETIVESKAKAMVTSGKWLQLVCEDKIKLKIEDSIIQNNKMQKKEERRKKATVGKIGGGNQGRETKTKSTKRKYLPQKHNEIYSNEELTNIKDTNVEHELISVEEVKDVIINHDSNAALNDAADEFAESMQPILKKRILLAAEKLAQHNNSANTEELKKELIVLITNIKMFYESTAFFEDEKQKNSLTDYLMKSLCREFTTKLFKLALQQNKMQCPDNVDFNEIKKLLPELPSEIQDLCSSLTKGSMAEFLNSATEALLTCSIIQKKQYSKDISKQLIVSHKEALLKELQITENPALALNLVTSLLFTEATESILHMSGRHVTMVLSFLQRFLMPDTISQLNKYCDLVRSSLSSSDTTNKMEAQEALKSELEQIKIIPENIKSYFLT